MRIKDRRLQVELNKIIKAFLQDGYLPPAQSTIASLGNYISRHNLSMPMYEYKRLSKEFTEDIMNETKSKVAGDLDIIYQSVIELYQTLESEINKFEAEKKKCDYKADKLESILLNIVNKYTTSGYTDSFVDNVVDMQNYNISKSTCDVDLQNKEVTLQKLQDNIYQNITDIDVIGTSLSQNMDIANAIHKKGVYWQGIISKPIQEETSLDIILKLEKQESINKLEVNMPLLKPCYINVYTSDDMDSWKNQYSGSIDNKLIVNLENSFQYIRFELIKTEADKFVGEQYKYYFLMDTIYLYQINYANSSTLISNPITFDNNINKVSIEDFASIPGGTEINYYISKNVDTPEWIPIVPINRDKEGTKIIDFNTMENNVIRDIELPTDISSDSYKMATINGQDIFSIDEIKGIEIVKSNLYKGLNSWKVEKIERSINGNADKTIFLNNRPDIVVTYEPIVSQKILNSRKFTTPTVLKFSTTIECQEGVNPVKGILISNFHTTVYLNGKLLDVTKPMVQKEITYHFKSGKNILEVIVNVNQTNFGQQAIATADLNIRSGFGGQYSNFPYSIATNVYADPEPLTEVSLFNLKYNTNNRKDVYALKQINDGYRILTKDTDLSIKYRLKYDYIAEEQKQLLFRADFSRLYNTMNITPRLKKYEIKII